MFNLRIRESPTPYESNDIQTLNDNAIGLFDDVEAKRLTSIVCNMKLHDIYISKNWICGAYRIRRKHDHS